MKNFLIDLGVVPYERAWVLQKKVHSLRARNEIGDTLILLEHLPVITIGRSGSEKNLLVPRQELKKRGISVYRVERGGDVTYHGPGQLVGYLIMKVHSPKGELKTIVHRVEEALIDALRRFNITGTHREKMRGVWVGDAKIAAIGIAVEERVTFHGFALNVNVNLDDFRLIVPCGLKGYSVTSMERILGRKIDMEKVINEVKRAFERVFGISFNRIDGEGLNELLEKASLDKEQIASG